MLRRIPPCGDDAPALKAALPMKKSNNDEAILFTLTLFTLTPFFAPCRDNAPALKAAADEQVEH